MDLYAAFADVARPAELHGCPCCVASDEGRPLLARPLRDLTAEDLARYAAKALSTWGGPEDFRYFAPRLLELAADDAFGYRLDAEVIFIKLGEAGWRDWPQREAIVDFFHAFWTRTLAAFPARPSVGTALCALGGAGADMGPLLDEWGTLTSEQAIRHLHEFVSLDMVWRHGRPRLSNAFWDTSSRPSRQVIAWLTGGPAAGAVSAAFARMEGEAALHLLAEIDSRVRPPDSP
ncbi:hypothetical protein [Spirillospora sp. NPDC048819]|uniref:hypothetical protein n=1 Tax=Spirillospora sp. NPDC048819 TaxID=3155268 RepID=UPI0034015099